MKKMAKTLEFGVRLTEKYPHLWVTGDLNPYKTQSMVKRG